MQSWWRIWGSGPICGDQLQEWYRKHSFTFTGYLSLPKQVMHPPINKRLLDPPQMHFYCCHYLSANCLLCSKLFSWFLHCWIGFCSVRVGSFSFCSGRLIRTFADVQYRNHHLTVVEIVYNVISFVVAIITTVGFTIYAKRTLNELEKAEANGEGSPAGNPRGFELGKLPLEKYKNSFTLSEL